MFGLTAVECFLCIIFIYCVAYWIFPKKTVWIPFALVVVLLSILAFNAEPYDTDDLIRYFTQLGYLREYGHDYLQRCIDSNVNGANWGTYRMCGYYFYFLSKFPDNHWMPAVTIFICYGLMFLVMYKASVRFNVGKLYLFIGTMFFLSTYWYYDTYSGIRNGLAFAVIFACAYYHLVERKFIPLCYLGYVLACLTHSASVILVALVILTEITLNNSGKFLNFLLVFGLAIGGAIMEFLSDKTDNEFVQSIASKAEKNVSGGDLYTQTLYLVNVSVFIIVALLFLYVSSYILNCDYTKELKRIYKFSSIIMYFMFGCLLSELIFMRISRWILPMIGALFYMIGMQIQSDEVKENGLIYYKYYAPPKEIFRFKIKPLFNLIFVGYTVVHLWYLCNGSSLNWLKF